MKALRTLVIFLSSMVFVPLVAMAEEESATRPVLLMTVKGNEHGIIRQFFGQVVARQTVDMSFQVAGQVIKFPVTEGEAVAKGYLIAELDLEPFELQLEQAKLQHDQAKRAFERLEQLAGTVSKVTREDAQTQLGLTRVALRSAEVALKNATLLAPFDALVAERKVGNFTTISQGSPVVRLHDMSEIRIEIDVPEILFQRRGQDSNVTLEARFPSSEQTYPLVIREFNAEASDIGQSFRLTLAMERPEGVRVLPGSSATVIASIKSEGDSEVIPVSAIRIGNDGTTSVMRFVQGEGDMGHVEEIAVEVAATRNGDFTIISGVEPGDEIVRAGAHALRDREPARRFSGYAN